MRDLPYFIDNENCVILQPELTATDYTMAHAIQVAVLEDHPVYRTGIKIALAPACHVCLEEAKGVEFLKKVADAHPQVVVLDLILPDMPGEDVARSLKEKFGDKVKILVVSVDTREETLQELMEIGIDGFLSKNAPEETMMEAVRTIVEGGTYYSRPEEILEREILIAARNNKHEVLTDREYDIMLALCKGMSCNEIAQQMYISPKTVDNHKQRIFAKLGIHNLVQLVTYAVRNKIIILS